jgi:hypothetical protein
LGDDNAVENLQAEVEESHTNSEQSRDSSFCKTNTLCEGITPTALFTRKLLIIYLEYLTNLANLNIKSRLLKIYPGGYTVGSGNRNDSLPTPVTKAVPTELILTLLNVASSHEFTKESELICEAKGVSKLTTYGLALPPVINTSLTVFVLNLTDQLDIFYYIK